ncbi:MAG: tetratricopeptide repeat protein [Gammaproteobacteria bacterium]|nr:tetratricopeptide repeat protein [Gammaproteobacteria bacterium]
MLVSVVPISHAQQEAIDLPAAQPAVNRLLDVAREAMQKGKFNEAYQVFAEVVRLDPNNAEAYYQQAIIHFQRGEFAQGLPLIRRSVELSPDNLALRFAYARALTESKNPTDAIEQYRYILSKAPPESKEAQEADKQVGLAVFNGLAAQGKIQEMDQIGMQLMRRHGGEPDVLHNIGITLYRLGRFDEAITIYRRLIGLVPNNPVAHFHLAMVLEAKGDVSGAEVSYQRVVDLAAKSPMGQTSKIKLGTIRGVRYLQGGDVVLARQEFEEVIKLDPDNFQVGMSLAALHHSANELPEAIKAYEGIVDHNPDNLEARLRLGMVYLDSRRIPEGVRELDLVVARGGEQQVAVSAAALLNRVEQLVGGRLAEVRQTNRDLDQYLAALTQSPADPDVYFKLGEIWLKLGNQDKAKEAFQKAAALDPGHADARLRLGYIYEEENKMPEAARQYSAALAVATDSEQIVKIQRLLLLAQGRQRLEKGELEGAEDAFREVLKRFDGDLTALWNMGAVKLRQGKPEDALGWYDEVIKRYPDQVGARMNMAQVYEQLSRENDAIIQYGFIAQSSKANDKMRRYAEQRADVLRRQTNGFSYALGYTLAMDDNANLSDDGLFEYRSDTYASVAYNYKINKNYKFHLDARPTYSTFHRGQYDFFNFTLAPSLQTSRWGYDFSLGYEASSQFGVLRAEDNVSRTNNFSLDASWRSDNGKFYQVNGSYRTLATQTSPFFDADTLSLNLYINRQFAEGMPFGYGYTFTDNKNNQPLGADYAYYSHALSGRLDKRLGGKVSVFTDGSATLYVYKNLDSSTLLTGPKRRINLATMVRLGGNYQWTESFSVNVSYMALIQRSNLPLGIVYDPTQIVEGIIYSGAVARQSNSLGGYTRQAFNIGVRYTF